MDETLSVISTFSDIEAEQYKETVWREEHERILVDWADKAMCYRWLHAQSNQKFSKLNTWFTIPVIIISTITGTANFAQDRFADSWKEAAIMAIGSLNIIAGIISTIQQFLKISELNEAHRVSSIAWDKFYRNIKMELTKNPCERIIVGQMLKICKEEYDRLMETSPTIKDEIIGRFKKTFKNSKTFNLVKKPEICDELVTTEAFRFKRKELEGKMSKMNDLIKKRKQLEKNKMDVVSFIDQFKTVRGREPAKNEIMENLEDKFEKPQLESLIELVEKDKLKLQNVKIEN